MVIEKYISAITYLGCTADTWGTIHTRGNEKGKPQQIHTSLEWTLLAPAAFAFAFQQYLVTATPRKCLSLSSSSSALAATR